MLMTPEGRPAGNIDRIMLLAMWARILQEEGKEIIIAGIGKPTFPMNVYAARAAAAYWNDIWQTASASSYGNPKGDLQYREKMAAALNRWYEINMNITADHILFTVGGASALYIIFEVINKNNPGGIIVTPFPHYNLYAGFGGKNKLYPIPVMQEVGYQLTAKLLSESLERAKEQAQKEGATVSAFLMCDPNNPLGTAIPQEELLKIAEELRKYPDLLIILDEAYTEMRLDETRVSLVSLAPDLKDRIVLIRSATKALSAAGERMAVIVAFNDELMDQFVEQNISICGHAPRSLQCAFSEAMDRLDSFELGQLRSFYKTQVEYVDSELHKMAANMPDKKYKPTGTFYVVGDFSDLIGLDLPPETQCALNKTGKIETDEDIAYYLLFQAGVMIAPLSYFESLCPNYQSQNKKGYMRITCSGGKNELKILMSRLENQLREARLFKSRHTQKSSKSILV